MFYVPVNRSLISLPAQTPMSSHISFPCFWSPLLLSLQLLHKVLFPFPVLHCFFYFCAVYCCSFPCSVLICPFPLTLPLLSTPAPASTPFSFPCSCFLFLLSHLLLLLTWPFCHLLLLCLLMLLLCFLLFIVSHPISIFAVALFFTFAFANISLLINQYVRYSTGTVLQCTEYCYLLWWFKTGT